MLTKTFLWWIPCDGFLCTSCSSMVITLWFIAGLCFQFMAKLHVLVRIDDRRLGTRVKSITDRQFQKQTHSRMGIGFGRCHIYERDIVSLSTWFCTGFLGGFWHMNSGCANTMPISVTRLSGKFSAGPKTKHPKKIEHPKIMSSVSEWMSDFRWFHLIFHLMVEIFLVYHHFLLTEKTKVLKSQREML